MLITFYPAINGWAIFMGTHRLAELDKFQFQQWALSLVHARPLKEGEGKGADRGVDGLLFFYEMEGRAPSRPIKKGPDKAGPSIKASDVHREKIIVQIKGGGTGAKDIRDLLGTVEK